MQLVPEADPQLLTGCIDPLLAEVDTYRTSARTEV